MNSNPPSSTQVYQVTKDPVHPRAHNLPPRFALTLSEQDTFTTQVAELILERVCRVFTCANRKELADPRGLQSPQSQVHPKSKSTFPTQKISEKKELALFLLCHGSDLGHEVSATVLMFAQPGAHG